MDWEQRNKEYQAKLIELIQALDNVTNATELVNIWIERNAILGGNAVTCSLLDAFDHKVGPLYEKLATRA